MAACSGISAQALGEVGLTMVRLPFLNPLRMRIALIWNARLAPFRPFISGTSSALHAILRFEDVHAEHA